MVFVSFISFEKQMSYEWKKFSTFIFTSFFAQKTKYEKNFDVILG